MTENEREILREREDYGFGQRQPWDSSRQAGYEDTPTAPSSEWEQDDE